MRAPVLPGMFPTGLEDRQAPARRVEPPMLRQTSIDQYEAHADRITGHRAIVKQWLADYYDAHQVWPTAEELARWSPIGLGRTLDASVVEIRRRISDLQRAGVVIADGQRVVNRKRVMVWRLAGGYV